MSKLSNYLEEAFLNHLLNNDPVSALATVYIALYTDDPTDADVGTEVSGGDYARVAVNANGGADPTWELAAVDGAGYSVANADDITFPTATAAWGEVTHVGIRDAAVDGNLLWHGALDESKTVGTGDTMVIAAGNIKLKLE